MLLFFTKFGKDPKKGVDRAWSNCQDRLLDLVGPLTRIFDLAKDAKLEGSHVDPDTLSNWAQRAICMLGNANSHISQERRKILLLRIDPKLSTLASKEEGLNADGLLFGDSFIKELGKYVLDVEEGEAFKEEKNIARKERRGRELLPTTDGSDGDGGKEKTPDLRERWNQQPDGGPEKQWNDPEAMRRYNRPRSGENVASSGTVL
ncbi:hypothetical protein NDU88_002783 [Pleurodeles waltl]|uniref:Uncharacterized protein n=1 Tax=Pleurodeles waltl TaxID=8319 RepID=A0AAV7WPK5_PLEWA|nr:hypothetical protein NDU88_002783 [Pleurodeles waltl]